MTQMIELDLTLINSRIPLYIIRT